MSLASAGQSEPSRRGPCGKPDRGFHELATNMGPWTRHLASLSLGFLLYEPDVTPADPLDTLEG